MSDDEIAFKKIVANFIVINRRSVVELNVDLEKYNSIESTLPNFPKLLSPLKVLASQQTLSPNKEATSILKIEDYVQKPEAVLVNSLLKRLKRFFLIKVFKKLIKFLWCNQANK